MDWANSALIITGGTRGLGLALAHELGSRGAKLAVVGQHQERLVSAVAALRRAGIEAYPLRADVGEKQAIHRLVGQAQALLGPLDGVIHNASTLGPLPLASLLDTECEDLTRVLEVNLLGPFRLSKALIPSFVLRGRGLVVHISSDAAVHAYPHWGAYGVSKAALDQLARSFAVELEASAVRVLSVDPGEMNTDMHRDALPDVDPATLREPAAVARTIVRIVEDRARYPSGARALVEGSGP